MLFSCFFRIEMPIASGEQNSQTSTNSTSFYSPSSKFLFLIDDGCCFMILFVLKLFLKTTFCLKKKAVDIDVQLANDIALARSLEQEFNDEDSLALARQLSGLDLQNGFLSEERSDNYSTARTLTGRVVNDRGQEYCLADLLLKLSRILSASVTDAAGKHNNKDTTRDEMYVDAVRDPRDKLRFDISFGSVAVELVDVLAAQTVKFFWDEKQILIALEPGDLMKNLRLVQLAQPSCQHSLKTRHDALIVLAHIILHKVRSRIYGGFVRDTIRDCEANDLDVWLEE